MGEKDITEKLLEDYEDVFSDIMNVLLFDGKEVVGEKDLTPANTISQYKIGNKIHEQERDVSKIWENNLVNIAMVGIENQTDIDADMPLRVIGYDGAAYRSQLLRSEKAAHNSQRYPVVTMVLYFGIKDRWKTRHLYDRLHISDELKPYVSDYHINVFEIAWLSDEQVNRFKSDFRCVADFFVQMRKTGRYESKEYTIRHVDEVLKMMSVLTGDRRLEDKLNASVLYDGKEGGTMRLQFLDEAEERGGETRVISQIIKKAEFGLSPSQIANDLLEDQSFVELVIEVINSCPPGTDAKGIYDALHKREAVS